MQEVSHTVFLKYYLEYYEKIYRYVYFRSYENTSLAEDITSDTFLKALEKFDTFDPEKSFSAWIYTIARNCIIDHFRKEKNYHHISLDEEIDNSDLSTNTIVSDVDNTFTQKEILKSLDHLPENQKEIILLKYFNHLDNKEISQMLDMNPTTLRVQQHRALKTLKEIIPSTLYLFILIQNVFYT